MDRRGSQSADTIITCARTSPLSRIQVAEVLHELQNFHPHIRFEPIWVSTTGDKDQKTSLMDLEKSNFFTKELDDMVIDRQCRIAIHSAKDLPSPLPKGLQIVAITKGLDPRDALVFRTPHTLDSLPSQAIIGTSSRRRQELISKRRSDLRFYDVRGAIHKRLQLLDEGIVDALLIAECALIRLGLTHLPREIFDDETVRHQGQLAVVARDDDFEMKQLFADIHESSVDPSAP